LQTSALPLGYAAGELKDKGLRMKDKAGKALPLSINRYPFVYILLTSKQKDEG
jgi:hypothetical protein